MAVDEKYIEEVRDESEFEDILKEMGVEASFEQTGNGVDLTGYVLTQLRDMYDEDECMGRPILSDIYTIEYTDKKTGETTTNFKLDFILLDDEYDDVKEAYIFPLNLKEDNLDQEKGLIKNVHQASGLYALVMGLMELKAKGISHSYNKLDIVNINAVKKQLGTYKNLTVQVVEKQMNGGNYYNSFRIMEGEQ